MFNIQIKKIIKLQKSIKERKKQKLFIIEGKQEIKMALNGNFILKKVFICKSILKKLDFCIFKKFLFFINKKIYKKISYRKTTEGIIGLFKKKNINYKNKINKYIIENKNNKNKKILILDNIEKPGNIGSIIRTLEASNIIDLIIINNINKDIYNPNIIRSSLGCIFLFPIFLLCFQDIIKFIIKNNFYLLGTSIKKKKSILLYNQNFYNKNIAIIFGNEHFGVSKIWKSFIHKNLNIPMYGKINSLNVGVAVGIIIFEIIRQEKFIINF